MADFLPLLPNVTEVKKHALQGSKKIKHRYSQLASYKMVIQGGLMSEVLLVEREINMEGGFWIYQRVIKSRRLEY